MQKISTQGCSQSTFLRLKWAKLRQAAHHEEYARSMANTEARKVEALASPAATGHRPSSSAEEDEEEEEEEEEGSIEAMLESPPMAMHHVTPTSREALASGDSERKNSVQRPSQEVFSWSGASKMWRGMPWPSKNCAHSSEKLLQLLESRS